MADRIELRGLRTMAIHGVLPEERSRPQPFEVDLDLVVDLDRAARSDDLTQTVDYAVLAERVIEVVEGPSFGLLEALASAIADTVLVDERVREATVTLRKLRPALAVEAGSVGVRLHRARAAPADAGSRSPG
jgi:dihydroneopterin aldolase